MRTLVAVLALVAAQTAASDIRLDCPEPNGWRFKVMSRTAEPDVEIVRVEMTRDEEAPPPRFALKWFVPQAGIHHLWTSASTHYGIPWKERMASELSAWMPLYAFLDANDASRWTIACSEARRRVVFTAPVSETEMGFDCAFDFFRVPEAPLREYDVEVRLDSRPVFYGEAIGDAAEWICCISGIEPMEVPDAAFDAVYSTWYDLHQDISAADVERECVLAARLGMKTIIVDDGWQIDLPLGNRPWEGYRLCGDWKPGRHFPDMAAHVKRVHEMGLRYMLWYSVPFVGRDSVNFARFKGKFLPVECAGGHVLDPRFPEVREFVAKTYEDAVREWDIDGLKLDFIGRFALGEGVADPAVAENYAGRDMKSISLAVDAMLSDVARRLKAIKPDILVEFRQPYVGPAIRRFGNMLRATDCPLSMVENRTRIARLRLTSGGTAVHSDMLEWRFDETAESAARCILNAIFGVVQYSMHLDRLPEDHVAMVAHWIRFAEEHRDALVKGAFKARFPANDYPLLEGEGDDERVIGVYQENLVVDVGESDRTVYVLNGANAPSLALDLRIEPARIEVYDTFGHFVSAPPCRAGLARLDVPLSGYVKVEWETKAAPSPFRFMTFNIYGAGYGDNFTAEERDGRIETVIRRYRPDVLSLQEVNEGWWNSGLFAALADDYAVVRGDEDEALARAGADLSQKQEKWVNHEPLLVRKARFNLLDSGLDFYHVSLQVEKSLTWAVLEDKTDGRRLIAFATHFWWKENGAESDAIREMNVRHVLARIAAIRSKWGNLPVAGGGDFNCDVGSLAMATFAQSGYSDAGEVAPVRSTVPSEHGPLVRDADGRCRGRAGRLGEPGHEMLDHIVFTPGFQVLRHDVVVDEDAIHVSDHSPVYADLSAMRRDVPNPAAM